MDAAGYATLGRQSGLMQEMRVVANNIANANTRGFRREGVIFTEYVNSFPDGPSLSMARASARRLDLSEAGIEQTGGTFDFAVRGKGFLLLETPQGNRLTRSGSFSPSAEGELVNVDGHRLLDLGGAPIFIPPDAGPVLLGQDGTLAAQGVPLARIGLVQPADPNDLVHWGGVLFDAPGGVEPVDGGQIRQGFLEGSNVNAITEVARMIEVQRAYELGQAFLDREDARVRGVIQTLGR